MNSCRLLVPALVAVLCLGMPALRAAPTVPLVFPKGDIELGIAKQHDEVTATAEIQNRGSTPITKIRTLSDCGCYSATVASKGLKPGESTTLTVRFRTLSFSGPMSKKLRVAFESAAGRQMAETRVKVSVVQGVIVRPGRLHFGQIDAGAKPEGYIAVVWYVGVGKPFQITDVAVPNAEIVSAIEPYTDPKRPRWKGWKVKMRFAEPPPRGLFRREATISTTSSDQPRVTVPISAHVVGKVWIQANRMALGLVPAGSPRAAHVLFRPAKSDVAFGTVRATSAKGVLRPAVTKAPTRRAPNMWRLSVTVPPGTPPGPLSDEILVHTGIPGEPPTTVRVVGRVFQP